MTQDDLRRSGAMPTTGGAGFVSTTYVDLLDRSVVKYVVVATWLIAVCVSINWAITLTGRTNLEWNPPDGTWAEDSRDFIKKYYPERVGEAVLMVAIQWEDENKANESDPITDLNVPWNLMPGGPPDSLPSDWQERGLLAAGTAAFTLALRQDAYLEWCNEGYEVLLPQCAENKTISGFDAFWTLNQFDPVAGEYLRAPRSKGYRSTIINIVIQGENIGIPDVEKKFSDWLNARVSNLSKPFLEPLKMKAEPFSIAAGVDEILDTVVVDLLLADGIAIPLSLIFAMIVLRNIRLMILPILAILATTLISMAIVAEIANDVLMNVIVTPVMISLVVGLPVGHCLFLLNRFREALLEGEDCKEAVQRMLSTAGTTITLSQLTLALCSFVIALVDVDQVKGLGWAILVCGFAAFLAAVMLVPAVLLCFPEFFEAATKRTKLFGVNERETVALRSRLGGQQAATTDGGRASIVPNLNKDLEDTLWHRYASVTQMKTFQNAIIVAIIIILVIPFGVVLLNHTKQTDSLEVYFPRRDTFTNNAERLFEDYGNGAATQFKIMGFPPENSIHPVFNVPVFMLTPQFDDIETMQFNSIALGMMSELSELKSFSKEGVIGAYNFMGTSFNSSSQRECGLWFAWNSLLPPAMRPPMPTDYSPSCAWRGVSVFGYSPKEGQTVPGFSFDTTDPTGQNLFLTATIVQMKTQIDPMGPEGYDFVSAFKVFQNDFNSRNNGTGAKVYMTGSAVNSHDAVQRINDAWSWMSPVFVLIGFLVILLGTKSVMVGLRAVFTTFLTIVFALGFTSLTYCHGALDWTDISALQTFVTKEGGDGAVHYFVFIITVPLIIGLSMCHELFLISTAHDWYHYHQLTTKEATKMALIGTGWMNIVSGCILAVSFIGHMFARLPILNQISFAMFWALLFDVLVVKTVLVPTMMAPFGKYNWWPAMARSSVEILENDPETYDVSMRQKEATDYGTDNNNSRI
eukprot:TRINITY_DN806_c0_g1_i2.p1 TRINITY_DN806_c0_g1~~TRINITY_DN806_c0_g1_i2.p1  ORF type:complete len:996 (+),score=254.06 TRINITY_DN806_c0_g1_i2:67-2988(+)